LVRRESHLLLYEAKKAVTGLRPLVRAFLSRVVRCELGGQTFLSRLLESGRKRGGIIELETAPVAAWAASAAAVHPAVWHHRGGGGVIALRYEKPPAAWSARGAGRLYVALIVWGFSKRWVLAS